MLQQRWHSRAAAVRCLQQQAARSKIVPASSAKIRSRVVCRTAGEAESSSSSSSSRPGNAQKAATQQQELAQQQQQALAPKQQQQQQQQVETPPKQQQQQQQVEEPPQQQQQQQPGYDPNAAAGFMPAPGQKPLWWVEKFEERRKQLAEQQQTTTTSSSSSGSGSAAGAPATSPSVSSSSSSSVASWFPKAVLQLLQLAVVNAALILWPASLHPDGLAAGNVWLAYWAYMLFFAGGSVYRLVNFGPLAARKKDAQGRTWWSTAAWLLFVISIPVIHWPPIGSFLQRQQVLTASAAGSSRAVLQGSVITAYDVLGAVLLAAAVGLNWWAARTLGRAYDRVAAPDVLVTDGPYKYVQHPIYSSYMLLFVGYGLLLHSAPTALLALAVCLLYYVSRTHLEQAVLQQAFGQPYEDYRQRTKLFVPFVL